MNTRVHGNVLSLSYHAIAIFEQLFFFSSKAQFPTSVFHEITGINALKKTLSKELFTMSERVKLCLG